jgi:hypothetical protein
MPEGEWFSLPMLWLIVQAMAAIASVQIFRLRIAPNVNRMRDARAVSDAIGPLALALPMIAGGFRTGFDVGGTSGAAGWITVGAPAICGMLALGIAAIVASLSASVPSNKPSQRLIAPAAAAAWSLTGAVLLMLGAAHDLTVWAGQCAFAAGAVLLWINTPELTREEPSPTDAQAGNGLTLVLLCAVAQGVAIGLAPASMLNVAAGIAIAHAAMIIALLARLASPGAAMRIGGWTATLGVLLGLGAISLRQLLPRALGVLNGEHSRPPVNVAYGFGEYALEATILLALGIAAIALEHLSTSITRRAMGALLILAAALLAGWRLAATSP